MTTIDFHSKSVSQSSSVSRAVDLKIKFCEAIGSNPGPSTIFFFIFDRFLICQMEMIYKINFYVVLILLTLSVPGVGVFSPTPRENLRHFSMSWDFFSTLHDFLS